MSHAEKSSHWRELKAAGVTLDRTYQQYSTEELASAVRLLRGPEQEHTPQTFDEQHFEPDTRIKGSPIEDHSIQPVFRAPDTDAGLRQNRPDDVRIDEAGLIWEQDEIRKPPYPKPRARRVLRYVDSGVKTATVVSGGYLETFEVAGDQQREAEVKITLPSYQVGIYRDQRFPFKIHIYNEAKGFDLFEVQDFYGGSELVPAEVKRIYVENVLCYDIRTTVRAIETEYRQQLLTASKGN